MPAINAASTIGTNLAHANVTLSRAEVIVSELLMTLAGDGDTAEADKASMGGMLHATRTLSDRLERLTAQLQRMQAVLTGETARAMGISGTVGPFSLRSAGIGQTDNAQTFQP